MATLALVLLSTNLALAIDTTERKSLNELRERQKKIQAVVSGKIDCVVVVSDGIGFGSGVLVSEDGLVLTAGHVMASSRAEYTVILSSGKELKAKPLGRNLNLDAGMIQLVDPGPYPYVELGNPDSVDLGDWCVCLGHPGGFKLGRAAPVRAGRVLELNANDLVTDCVLIGGDSGGPLFDLQGKLIGIHSSIGNSIAVNRHVNMRTYQDDWERLKKGERWGVLPSLNSPSPERKRPEPTRRAALGLTVEPSDSQARVIRIKGGSPAEKAGIQIGDLITRIDQLEITASADLVDYIRKQKPGTSIRLELSRSGNTFAQEVVLTDASIHR